MKTLTKIDNFLNNFGQWLVILAGFTYTLIFAALAFWKYFNFQYNALDLAIINQAVYLTSLGKFFASSIHPPTYLGDHFTPVLFLFLPFYFVFKHPLVLLVIQTIILAGCSWPIYLIAKNVLNKKWAILFALSWLINPFVQNINLFEFHFLPTAIFFILFAFYFYLPTFNNGDKIGDKSKNLVKNQYQSNGQGLKGGEVYQKQKRKGKDIPYITHPLTVGIILSQIGASEDVVCAGELPGAHETVSSFFTENPRSIHDGDCPCAPASSHAQDDHVCFGGCNGLCHAPLASAPTIFSYLPFLISLHSAEITRHIPEVHLSFFVPPDAAIL